MTDPLFDLTGKTALITGASRGIGEASAHLFARHGAHVIVSSRKLDACEEVDVRGFAVQGVGFAEALTELPSDGGSASSAMRSLAASNSARWPSPTHSSTSRFPAFTLSSIDLLAICTISVCPFTSSSRIAPVDDSTGFIR